ncbi:MAG: DUF1549 domain-containing protein, partial [Acidobacteriota bacterium]|nr:DUF1549 domain-containing protein [Acidobacteriota bacterium]
MCDRGFRIFPVLLAASALTLAQTAPSVLKLKCQPCHNDRNPSSGLSVESRESILTGGNRGPALKPSAAGESLIVRAVEQTSELKMPPNSRLTNDQIGLIRRWIDEGAIWPEDVAAKKRPGWDHWAFQVPRHPVVPPVRNSAWVRNEIDNFILARLEAERIQPSPETDPNTLLRRVSLDLTGLPPTAKEIEDFRADRSANAYEKVVDRLLASPHYGERWGRHWLDVARYADSDGYTIDSPRQIWKYRDWVIEALNLDMPFDQFTIEQVAGDLLPHPTTPQLIATGFHRNTPSNFEGGIDFEQYRVEAVADRVATTGAVFLGLTTGCARCHDHKFDPISQREFYQLFAYFNNTDEIASEDERYDFNRPILELPTPEQVARREAYNAQVAQLSRELAAYVKELAKQPFTGGKDPGLLERMANLRALRAREPHFTSTLVIRELPNARPAYIHLGGDFLRHGAAVQPGVPAVL